MMMQRLLLSLVALGVLAFALAAHPAAALAQPHQAAEPAHQIDLRGGADQASPHDDRVEGSGVGLALLFWAFAAATVGGALFVVTRRNLVAAVMGMVGSFLGVSAIYMMLYANFLSVVQMLVYAGAIMVLFVFVIMILNRPEADPVGPGRRVGKVVGGVALLYLFLRVASMLASVTPANPARAAAAPTPINGHEWGSLKAVGNALFHDYVFPFEAISICLLVAVVGAIAIARPLHEDAEEGA
ncbi:MAG: NADH-quinone oxidoreductase subunit J [Kofleriaceae bacterium]